MSERDSDSAGQPPRDQTDESLRAERARVDALVAKKGAAVEAKADGIVHVARIRADAVTQRARDDADDERAGRALSGASTAASLARERDRADDRLEDERSHADQLVEDERAERRRYLADFLAVERGATDKDLVRERDHADTSVAARDEFLANVAHDLRSLLGGLSLNTTLLSEAAPAGTIGDRVRRQAGTSGRLIARMNRLINDLLDVVSIEAGKLAILHERVEVDALVRETLEAFTPIADAKGVTLDADAPSAPLHAHLDAGRVLQVLANLVSNAIKFTPAGGRVTIAVRLDADALHFTVRDTGCGMPSAALEQVFERFRQVSKDRRGLGLGLHISKGIIEAHGGTMWAESTPGHGSTLHFTLPGTEGLRGANGRFTSSWHPSSGE